MSTTNLFVELLVIGVGAVAWALLLIFSLVGNEWLKMLPQTLYLLPSFALIYLFGVLVDRFADWLMRPLDRKIRREEFGGDNHARLRIMIYAHSDGMRELYEHSRSRLRVCRGWIFNAPMIAATANIYIWSEFAANGLRTKLSISAIVFGIVVGLGSYLAWLGLTRMEYMRLRIQARLLEQEGSAPGR